MGWHYKPPATFPALFLSTLYEAAAFPNTPVAAGSGSRENMQALAEKFRHFRWCIRHDPGANSELFNILETYDVRSTVITDEVNSILSITAKVTKISEFARLNPDLANEVLPECQ